MGVLLEVAASVLTAGVMSILPVIFKLINERTTVAQHPIQIEIKSPSGRIKTIEVKKDMSVEEVHQVSQQLTNIIKSETSTS